MAGAPLHREPAWLLERRIARIEADIIAGTATDDDIDDYVTAQLELARRPALEWMLDPRD
jgi:hypothetical protein